MTNNLKLKVFDKNDRALHDVILVNYENDYDIVVEWYNNKNEKRSAFVSEVPVLKTPGLCDINGKLIFEGDIFVKKYFYPFYNYKNKEDKKLSAKHRRKISEANKKRKGIKIKKRVDMPHLQEYIKQGLSINKISKIYGCDWSTVKNRIYENPELLEASNDLRGKVGV